MSFLRKRDYFSKIREKDLDEVLVEISQTSPFTPDQVREQSELEVISEVSARITHRYDVRKIFINILTYLDATQFNIGDQVNYTELAYDATLTYVSGDRRSFSQVVGGVTTDDIFEANTTIGTPEAFDPTKWDKLTENNSLYVAELPTTANKPATDFVFSSNLFTGSHDTILGWDKTNDIFLTRDAGKIKIYYSSADRTNDNNSIGEADYDPSIKQFPTNIPITDGIDLENTLTGDLSVIGFVPDGTDWNVTATNFWTKEDARDHLIKGIVLDITIFELHGLINPRNIPVFIGDRRDNAMNIVKNIQKGIIAPDLPIYFDKERGQEIAFGSSKKNSYRHFEVGHRGKGHIDDPDDFKEDFVRIQ